MATVVAAEFEDLVSIGLSVMIDEGSNLDLVARGVPMGELPDVLAEHSPSVVLLNLDMLGGPEDVLALHRAFPGTSIVVMANRPTAGECAQLLAFGATGCLSKETEGRDVVTAVHLASRGMHVLPRSAAAGGDAGRLGLEGAELTAREAEVSELLQDGRTNAEIAEALSIGIETVRTHARSVFRKLGVPSRRELARRAQQEAVAVDEDRRPVPAP
jgi:DNA-binding NarL/FixJ family response regulator